MQEGKDFKKLRCKKNSFVILLFIKPIIMYNRYFIVLSYISTFRINKKYALFNK